MKYLKTYQGYNLISEWSKNDPIPELTHINDDKLAIFLMGSPAAGKCLEYNTNIHLSNGDVVKIGDFIENEIEPTDKSKEVIKNISKSNTYVQSLDENFNIINNKIINLYRGYADELVNVKTQTGVDIKVTKTHPLLILSENGDIGWKEAGLISKSDKIATPRAISNDNDDSVISEEMSRIIGYILSDGDLSISGKSKYINFASVDLDTIEDFNRCIISEDEMLTLDKRHKDVNDISYTLKYSNVIPKDKRRFLDNKRNFIEKIENMCDIELYGKKSHAVEIPDIIMCNKLLLKNFIGAYFSCDGSILTHGVIEIYSSSKKIIEQFSYALLKFGVLTTIKNKKSRLNGKYFDSYVITILKESNSDFYNTFKDYISCGRKVDLMKEKLVTEVNSNIGGYTLNESLVDVVYNNKLSKKVNTEIGKIALRNLSHRRKITNVRLNKLFKLFNESGVKDERIDYFNNLYSNILFDSIKNIEIIEHNDYVYDIVLESNHNFVGGNKPVILHNSTFIKNFIKTRNNIKDFSSDDISLMFTKDPNVRHRGSGELNIKRIDIFMETGQSFIYDTTPTYSEDKVNLITKAKEYGYKVIFVALITPLDVALRRNQKRDRKSSEEFLKHTYNTIWSKLSQHRDLKPDSFYVITDLNNQYTFYKYDADNKKLLKRKGSKYV